MNIYGLIIGVFALAIGIKWTVQPPSEIYGHNLFRVASMKVGKEMAPVFRLCGLLFLGFGLVILALVFVGKV